MEPAPSDLKRPIVSIKVSSATFMINAHLINWSSIAKFPIMICTIFALAMEMELLVILRNLIGVKSKPPPIADSKSIIVNLALRETDVELAVIAKHKFIVK